MASHTLLQPFLSHFHSSHLERREEDDWIREGGGYGEALASIESRSPRGNGPAEAIYKLA